MFGQVDRLQFEVGGESFGSELASESRLLEPSERQPRVVAEAVHRDGSGADAGRCRHSVFGVGCEHGAGQPIARVIGDSDGLVLVSKGITVVTGAKSSSCAIGIPELTWVTTVGEMNHPEGTSAGQCPPRGQDCARLHSPTDVVLDAGELPLADEWTKHCVRVPWVAEPKIRHGGESLRDVGFERLSGTARGTIVNSIVAFSRLSRP